MAKTKSLADLFVNLLKDMYYAEKQIVKTLPKLAKHADSAELRKAFEHHLKETEGQVQRLEQVFALCDLKPVGKTCPAIKGILEEGDEDIKEAGRSRCARRRHDRRRAGRRALRDRPLRHNDRLGGAARHEGSRCRFCSRRLTRNITPTRP